MDGVYWAVITSTTIGYGDVSPKTKTGRVISLFVLPMMVLSLSNAISAISGHVMSSRQRKQEVLKITIEDLLSYDDDAQVTKHEFIIFVLQKMNKIDNADVDLIQEHFVKLDADKNGRLDMNDFMCMREREIQNELKKEGMLGEVEIKTIAHQRAHAEAVAKTKALQSKNGNGKKKDHRPSFLTQVSIQESRKKVHERFSSMTVNQETLSSKLIQRPSQESECESESSPVNDFPMAEEIEMERPREQKSGKNETRAERASGAQEHDDRRNHGKGGKDGNGVEGSSEGEGEPSDNDDVEKGDDSDDDDDDDSSGSSLQSLRHIDSEEEE